MQRRHVLTAIGAIVASGIAGSRAPRGIAQGVATPGATPMATPTAMTPVVLIDSQRRRVGLATLAQGPGEQVTLGISIDRGALAPGQYAITLNETGICDPSGAVPFSSAGGAVPFSSAGGLVPTGPTQAIGAVTIEGDAGTTTDLTTDAVTLERLSDRDGTSLVLERATAGDALGVAERVACGVIYPPAEVATATAEGAATPATAAPGAGATPGAGTTEVTVEMVDIAFNPSELTIPANTDVTVHLPNHGAIVHNFSIDALDVHSGDIPAGEETSVTINAEPGEYEYYCSIPGHLEAGMVGTMRVE